MSVDGSESASDSEQNDPPSSLVADAEQYELVQITYAAVGKDFFTGNDDLIGSEHCKLQKLEMVPERWPLARLSFSLQTCVNHLDRVLAGCCWEVQSHTYYSSDSLTSLHEVVKCLTIKLAANFAKEVAAILRAVLTHETKKLYNDSTVHLLLFQLLDTADLPVIAALIVPTQCYQGRREKATQQWLGTGCSVPNHPNSRSHRLLALASVTGLEVLVMRIPCRQITRLGWTRRWLLWTFASNGRRHVQTDVCREQHPSANRHH